MPRCLLPPQPAVGPEDQHVVLVRRRERHDVGVDLLPGWRDMPEGTLLEPQLPVRAQDDHVVDVKRLEGQDVAVNLLTLTTERGRVEPQVSCVVEHPHPRPYGLREETPHVGGHQLPARRYVPERRSSSHSLLSGPENEDLLVSVDRLKASRHEGSLVTVDAAVVPVGPVLLDLPAETGGD